VYNGNEALNNVIVPAFLIDKEWNSIQTAKKAKNMYLYLEPYLKFANLWKRLSIVTLHMQLKRYFLVSTILAEVP